MVYDFETYCIKCTYNVLAFSLTRLYRIPQTNTIPIGVPRYACMALMYMKSCPPCELRTSGNQATLLTARITMKILKHIYKLTSVSDLRAIFFYLNPFQSTFASIRYRTDITVNIFWKFQDFPDGGRVTY
jgi:hypothetical protein